MCWYSEWVAVYFHVCMLICRNDWNLLSTATPAINAWMNPCHRAIQASDILYGQLSKRVCTVMACIMTEALDHQHLHMPYRVSIFVFSLLKKWTTGMLLFASVDVRLFTLLLTKCWDETLQSYHHMHHVTCTCLINHFQCRSCIDVHQALKAMGLCEHLAST